MAVVRVSASKDAVAEVEEQYLSVCLDLGQIAEPTRFWNPDGSGEVVGQPTFDFERSRIRNMTKALAPAYLRIGGTEADRCFYALEAGDPTAPVAPFKSTLTAAHLDAIGAFAKAVGLDVCFTLNAGRATREAETGAWESGQARRLMRYVAQRKYPFTVFELGNEPNAWPLFHGGLLVEPEAYARDVQLLCAARDAECPQARVAGPSCAFWPTIGEVDAFTLWPPRRSSRFTARVLGAGAGTLDVLTWHFYPGRAAGGRGPLPPLEDHAASTRGLVAPRAQAAPTHSGAPAQPLGSLPRPQELAAAHPRDEHLAN